MNAYPNLYEWAIKNIYESAYQKSCENNKNYDLVTRDKITTTIASDIINKASKEMFNEYIKKVPEINTSKFEPTSNNIENNVKDLKHIKHDSR